MIVKNSSIGCMSHDCNLFAAGVGRYGVRIFDRFGKTLHSFKLGKDIHAMCFSNDKTKLYIISAAARNIYAVHLCNDTSTDNIEIIPTGCRGKKIESLSLALTKDGRYLIFHCSNWEDFTSTIYAFDIEKHVLSTLYHSYGNIISYEFKRNLNECLFVESTNVSEYMQPVSISKIHIDTNECILAEQSVLFTRALNNPCRDGGEITCYARYYGINNDIIIATSRCIEIYNISNDTYVLKDSCFFSVDETGIHPGVCAGILILGNSGFAIYDASINKKFMLFFIHKMKFVKVYDTCLNYIEETGFVENLENFSFAFESKIREIGYCIFFGSINDLLSNKYDDIFYPEN